MIIQFKNIFKIIPFFFVFVTMFFHRVANMDASHPWQTGFQDPATPIMEGIIFFNGLLMSFMILISCLVGWLLYKSLSLFNESVHQNPVGFTHSTLLEVVWTIIPAVILMIISIPSYNLLYAMDEVIDPSLTIKVVGHQWYWSYECSDFDVSPKDQEEGKELLDHGQKLLNLWISIVKDANLEVGASENQTQTTLAQDLLNDLDNHLKDFPRELSKEESDILANRLNLISMLLCKNEGFGGSEGKNEKLLENSIIDVLSSVKDKLEKFQFIDDQKDLVVKILKTFKQYLKITEDLQPGDVNRKLITSLFTVKLVNDVEELPFDKIENHLPTIYGLGDFEGSDSFKSPKSDDDSNDDDGSVITKLVNFDNSKWCELDAAEKTSDQDYYNLKMALGDFFTSERRCNNAALLEPEPEDENRPFLELVDDLIQDLRKFKKARRVEELSESKLIDTQLIDHQLKLTRAERELYSSEFAYENAASALNFAKNEFNVVLDELNAAKLYSHLCDIDLAASNVNKLTAEYFQAEAASAVTDPKLLRSAWINKKGYYSWHKFLKLVAKKLSEAERLAFIHADEDLCKANCLLGKVQKNLTQEEIIRSNAIADNAKAKFMAMEREVISAMEELKRGELIVEEAKAELRSYQEISNKANVRLENAKDAFEKVKLLLDRNKAIFRGSEKVFKDAQLTLENPNSTLNLERNEKDLVVAQKNFIFLKDEFDKAVSKVNSAKSDLLLCKERLKSSNMNLLKTEEAFKNTGLLRAHEMRDGAYLEHYPNYLWEMRQEDLAFVKDQWGTDTSYVQAFETSLNDLEKQLSNKANDLLDSEIKKTEILIDNLKLSGVDNYSFKEAVNHLSGIKLDIAKAVYNKALIYSGDNSKISQTILNIAETDLHDAQLNDISGYSGSVFSNKIKGINSEKLISGYAESCLDSFRAELEGAEADYDKAAGILNEAENLLLGASQLLSREYSNPCLATLKSLHEKTLLSLSDRFEHLNMARIKYSPLDIKLDPGLLQSKSYEEVLLAEAELANIKWLCARIAKTLDLPLSNDVKPFNVQFSYLKENASVELVNNNSSVEENVWDNGLNGGEDDNFGGKKKPKSDLEIEEIISRIVEKQFPSTEGGDDTNSKSVSEIKKIMSQTPDREFANTSNGLEKKIIYSFADLLKSLNKDDSSILLGILNQAFDSMLKDQVNQNQAIEDQINLIKEELAEWKDKEIENERINFDSYLIADEDLIIPEALGTGKAGKVFRLLEVDNRLFVPTNTHIRLLVTSADVLHSWAVPSLGVKVDACPGRLNQVFLFVKREGVFYGQCSELCGVNHGFMPIVVQAVSQDEYLTWVGKRLCS